MNRDVRLEPLLERLLAETPTSRAPDRLRADIASATSHTRQRPPWLTSLKEPPMRYRSQLVVGSPTLRLAAVVALTAVLTLALAGAVIAGASLLPSPVPVPPVPPTRVTGEVGWGLSCAVPDTVVEGDVTHERNQDCSPQPWTASDPRLSGESVSRWNDDAYLVDGRYTVVLTSHEILTNDAGAWACTGTGLYEGLGLDALGLLGDMTTTCVGQDGYEGLTAILVRSQGVRAEEFVGLIFSGDIPPEPPAAQ
jgi:hypothetical protein